MQKTSRKQEKKRKEKRTKTNEEEECRIPQQLRSEVQKENSVRTVSKHGQARWKGLTKTGESASEKTTNKQTKKITDENK
jgi:hypothetical protein